ncbi:AsmA family protein [Pandoraea sp. CB10b_02]|uniref:AsmA family protein n=1 Tax=Pandoraea sp. CB10b_02 TaxID=2014535 RepID=UPI002579FAC1|nr:AsmA family protein [Pandoraea sp. CB10b_02]
MMRWVTSLKWLAITVVAIVLAFAAFITWFDWNYARPWINREVSTASGRPFEIRGDLSLHWLAPNAQAPGLGRWLPRPRLIANDIVLGNVAWSQTPDMITVGRLTFSLEWLPLLDKRVVLPEVTLSAPKVLIEQRADGQNNWTFTKGNGEPSPWKLRIGRLILEDGVVRANLVPQQLDLTANIATIDGQAPYGIGVTLKGTFRKVAVTGKGRGGDVLSLEDSGEPYPLDASVRIGRTLIAAQGTFTNPATLSALDMHLRLAGPTMADLYPITGVLLPETPPYETNGHLLHTAGIWRYERFQGKVGQSDLSGTLVFRQREPRNILQGAVVSNQLRLADLGPVVGGQNPSGGGDLTGKPKAPPSDKVLPVDPFKTDRWRAIDADVQFTGRKIVRDKSLPIDNLVTHLVLDDGVLSLKPLEFGVAGGRITSNLVLNGQVEPMKVDSQVSLRHLKMKQLLPDVDLMKTSVGEVNGDAALTATGNSIAALAGSSNGEIKTLIDRGSVSKLLLEYLGLNVGNIVLTKLFGDKQIEMRCAAADFAVKDGIMDARTFVIDTDDTSIGVTGQIDLKREHFNLTIRPEPKHFGLLSLRSPLHVRGTFKHPDVGVNMPTLVARAGGAIALGVLAPYTALVPLLELGPGQDSPCGELLASLQHPPSRNPANVKSTPGASAGKRGAKAAPPAGQTPSGAPPTAPASVPGREAP